MQGLRDGKFAAFENALHYTPTIEAMLHAALAWEAAEKGESALNDPVTQALLNGAAIVRKQLFSKLGSDLTVTSDVNPFWHTGNPVKVCKKNIRSHQPWEDLRRVADGRVPGKDRSTNMCEHWSAFTTRVMRDQLFQY